MKKQLTKLNLKTRELTTEEQVNASGGAMVVVVRGPRPGGTDSIIATGTNFAALTSFGGGWF